MVSVDVKHHVYLLCGIPISLTLILLSMNYCLFGLYESERRDEIFIGVRPPSSPVPNKPYSVDVKHHNYLLFFLSFLSLLFVLLLSLALLVIIKTQVIELS